MNKADVYQIVTDRIISLLETGTVPWHKPWVGGEFTAPRNLVSGKVYQGINFWMLGSLGFESPYWLTFRQAVERGGHVRKGEKSTLAVFWKMLNTDKVDAKGKPVTVPMLRYYNVFNVAQCEGVSYPKPEGKTHRPFSPIESCEQIVAHMPNRPTITRNEAQAYYSPLNDTVNMPRCELFKSDEEYYSVFFHELTHSTGHASRLNRGVEKFNNFGSKSYSKEELIAEMGAAYLCGMAGIVNQTIDNSAAYVAGWLKALRNDPKLIIQAAGAAQKASDYILATAHDTEEESVTP